MNFLYRRISYFFFLLFTVTSLQGGEHREKGTDYGEEGVALYAEARHGPDGALFLDPYFIPSLLHLEGEVLLDAGCGAGPWSLFAAQNGAVVYGIDIQEGMIAKAREAAVKAGLEERVHFAVGDVGALPYPDAFFDKAISINVGCNLPCLESHLTELYRVLKEGGVALITAPASFGTVFTDGQRPHEEIVCSLQQLLDSEQASFPQGLLNFKEVYRATFAKRGEGWSLILDEKELIPGEAIYRKIPSLVVPNYYHGPLEYLACIKQAGFCLKEIHAPHFESQADQEKYNAGHAATLGSEYVECSPFVIFVIEKKRNSPS